MESSDFKSTILNSILILLFEFIGTTFLTLLFTCNAGVSTSKPYYLEMKQSLITFCYRITQDSC